MEKLAEVLCSDLVPPRKLITIKADTNLFEILQMFEKHNIHSFPVETLDKATGKVHVVGMIDILDVVCSVFDAAQFEAMRNKETHELDAGVVAEHFIDTRKLQASLASISAMTLLTQRKKQRSNSGYGDEFEANVDDEATPFGPELHRLYLYPDDALPTVLSKLGRYSKHRLPIVEGSRLNDSCDHGVATSTTPMKDQSVSPEKSDKSSPSPLQSSFGHHGEMVNLLSQSDIIKFVQKNKASLPEKFLKTPLTDIMNTNLITIHASSALAQALYLFKQKKVMCVLVEDSRGRLIAPVSATDFVSKASDLSTFSLAVDEFLAPKDEADAKAKNDNVYNHIVPFTMTIEGALDRFAQGKIYRLLIESEEDSMSPSKMTPGTRQGPAMPTYGIVKGIVTLRDVLKEVSKFFHHLPK